MPEAKNDSEAEKPKELRGVLAAGTRLRSYELVSVLGQGGFGITYRARDTILNRDVAIKEYLPIALALREGDSTVVPRSTDLAEEFIWGRDHFLQEARTLATLEDAPAVIRVIDFLEANGTAYMVMALARGETLEQRLKREGPLPPPAIERLLPPLLDGLHQVHDAGFLHRDIKPANIVLDARGNPTLIDFGAARAAMAGRTTAMTAIFTPGYAAAEQFTSGNQGPWTDIYGLSATLHHAITGEMPPSAFERMLGDSYEPLGRRSPPGFPSNLLEGIDAGLAVRANERPQSTDEWRKIFDHGAARVFAEAPTQRMAKPVRATSPTEATPQRPWTRRRPAMWAGAALAAFLILAGGGYGLFVATRPPTVDTAVQNLTAEELTRALEERRKADALAADKKRLEEEAQRKAEADAEAKRKADEALATAQQQRQQAEAELAKLKADMEARQKADAAKREQADAAAKQALEEAAKRNEAEAQIAALRKADEEAKQKAAADALAKQQADEAAQRKAEAEAAALRQAEEDAQKKAAAEAETKRQADEALAKAQADRQRADEEAARQKADADAKQKAAAEAKQKAEADAKQKAEADAKQKAESEAKAKAETAENSLHLATPDRQHLQVALTSLGFDTRGYDGAFGPRSRDMIAAWQKARNLPPTGFLDAAQQQALLKEGVSAVNKYDDDQKKIEDDKKKAEEEAKKKADEEAKKKTDGPSVYSSAAPEPQTDAERQRLKEQTDAALNGLMKAVPGTKEPSYVTPAPAAGAFDGTYAGGLSVSYSSGTGFLAATVRIAGDSLTGTLKGQGNVGAGSQFSATVAPSGEFSGRTKVSDNRGSQIDATLSGRVSDKRLLLNMSGPGVRASGTLTLGAVAPAIVPSPSSNAPQSGDLPEEKQINLDTQGGSSCVSGVKFTIRVSPNGFELRKGNDWQKFSVDPTGGFEGTYTTKAGNADYRVVGNLKSRTIKFSQTRGGSCTHAGTF